MRIFPQKRGTERVYRLHIRLIDAQKLTAQMAVFRVLSHTPGEFRGDFAPQFRRRRFRIGDNQKIVNIAVFFRHIAEQALYQNFRLA